MSKHGSTTCTLFVRTLFLDSFLFAQRETFIPTFSQAGDTYSRLSSNQDRMTTKQTNANVTNDEARCRNPSKLLHACDPHTLSNVTIHVICLSRLFPTNRQFKQRESLTLSLINCCFSACFRLALTRLILVSPKSKRFWVDHGRRLIS